MFWTCACFWKQHLKIVKFDDQNRVGDLLHSPIRGVQFACQSIVKHSARDTLDADRSFVT